MAIIAIRKKMNENEYIEKARKFFQTGDRTASISEAYNIAGSSATAKAEQVRTRKTEIENALV